MAQEPLVMEGTEKIDSKERISGNAVVGFSFQDGCKEFDPGKIHVFLGWPAAISPKKVTLTTQLTTVDGRYIFDATKPNVTPDNIWHALDLKKKTAKSDEDGSLVDDGSLDKEFLNKYIGEQLAILVSDEDGRVYPVRCGCPGEKSGIRIQVNAEGADAYFPEVVEGSKRALATCTRVERSSNFKFDHYCDLEAQDIKGVDTYPIMRKRGATFDNPINVRTIIPDKPYCKT